MKINGLPHIKNVASGINKWDPVHNSVYEVYISVPNQLQQTFGEDGQLLSQQVVRVSGLDVLQKTTAAGQQTFYGATVSYLNPVLEGGTSAEITITFNLNLRNVYDNFVLKLFKAWENLSYDLSDGTRGIKMDYISDVIRVAEANRNGEIWRSYIFHHVMLTNVQGLNDLDYTNNEARTLECTFRCDYWDDEMH